MTTRKSPNRGTPTITTPPKVLEFVVPYPPRELLPNRAADLGLEVPDGQ